MQTFRRFLFLLKNHERKRAAVLLLMILTMALIDMIGIASILPFMAVLTNPSIIETNNFLNTLFETSKMIGIENNQEFLFSLGLLVFILLILSLSVRALTTYLQFRFVQMLDYGISKRLIEGYLNQPYSWFLNRHSADIGKNVLSEISLIIGSGIKPILEIFAKGMVAIAIIILLFLANPKLTLIIGLFLGGAYILIFYFIRNYLRKIGKKRLKNNELRFKSVLEAFGAVKQVKVSGLEQSYINRFSNPSYIFAETQASSGVIAQLPRFILEGLAFGGVLLIILFMMGQSGNFNTVLPLLSMYVFAGYRLMPALQQIYSASTQLAFIGPSIEKLYEDIKNLKSPKANQSQSEISFNKSIKLKDLNYNYPNTLRKVLNEINLTVNKKSTVGLVGTTGSGKTTLVDIILGLLVPEKGTLEVDGKVINNNNVRAWQKIIGYVPQNIYLIDDTISANIAFGVKSQDINKEAVEKASKIANLHDFVIDELPNKYETTIGERGVRLSGGQIQRIGIARALYNNPQVLVLDEATSALDNLTEQAVVDAINNLTKKITIILIAHRLNTVKNCDVVFKLEKGHIVDQGTYDEVINVNNDFN